MVDGSNTRTAMTKSKQTNDTKKNGKKIKTENQKSHKTRGNRVQQILVLLTLFTFRWRANWATVSEEMLAERAYNRTMKRPNIAWINTQVYSRVSVFDFTWILKFNTLCTMLSAQIIIYLSPFLFINICLVCVCVRARPLCTCVTWPLKMPHKYSVVFFFALIQSSIESQVRKYFWLICFFFVF